MKRLILLFPLLVSLADGQRPVTLEGEVDTPSEDLMIELIKTTTHFAAAKVTPSRDGHFEFRGIEEGYYELRVTNTRGDILYQDHVGVHMFSPHVSIRLRAMTKQAR